MLIDGTWNIAAIEEAGANGWYLSIFFLLAVLYNLYAPHLLRYLRMGFFVIVGVVVIGLMTEVYTLYSPILMVLCFVEAMGGPRTRSKIHSTSSTTSPRSLL